MKFVLTIDTEGDNQWDHGRKLTVENIRYVPRFQNLCDKYKIKPTYLVTSEVCVDAFAREIFSEYVHAEKAEIGAHLHAWTTPPFLEKDGYRYNDRYHAFGNELPQVILSEKIRNITHQIENSFGKRPTSFRGGRFGFSKDMASILAENSYLVDSSVTPYVRWTSNEGLPGGIGGPDFIGYSPFPYKYEFSDRSLLEIPVTILPVRFPLNKSSKLAEYYFKKVDNNLLLRTLRKFLFSDQPSWLRPTPDMSMHLFNVLLRQAIGKKLPFFVMMFHSSELMPGCSKYRPDEDSVEKLYEMLESFFEILAEKDIEAVTLTEAVKIHRL